jgi:HSP20 family protein
MTNLVYRDPISQQLPISYGQINKLFNNLLGVDEGLTSTTTGPAVTIYETKDEYVVQAEVPGWTRDQISINFENQTLVLSGKRDLTQEQDRQYHRVEGFYGQFSRSFTLPSIVDINRVEAELRNGLLTIHMPKKEEAKPRQIEVKTVQ